MSVLLDGAEALGIALSSAQLAAYDQFGAAIREGNQRANLTRITDLADVERLHFLDSLTASIPLLPELQRGEVVRLVDVGSGAGLPGLALKIAFPLLRVTLVEATGKKAAFLREVVEMLRLPDVEVLALRAEEAARLPEQRDRHQLATARALGRLPEVIELCAPFLEPGGLLVAQRRGNLDAEITAAAPAFRALKMWARIPIPISVAGLVDGRGLVVGEKYDPTPSRFPRRSGQAKRNPLA